MLKLIVAAGMMLIMAETTSAFAKERIPYATCVTTYPSGPNTCLAYVGQRDADSLFSNTCTGPNHKWSKNTPCPAQNSTGVCKFDEGKPSETWSVVYHSQGAAGSVSERDGIDCKSAQGKWYPQK